MDMGNSTWVLHDLLLSFLEATATTPLAHPTPTNATPPKKDF